MGKESTGSLEKQVSIVAKLAGIFGTLVTVIGLVVAYFSYSAAVHRGKVDRTLALVSLADQPHFNESREAFRLFHLRLWSGHRRVSPSQSETRQWEDFLDIVDHLLMSYKTVDRDAWFMVGRLGDYYDRILACISTGACDEKIFCASVHRELVIFAEMTEKYRRRISGQDEPIYAQSLDDEARSPRCQ